MMAIIDKMSSVWLYWLLESVYSFPLRLVVLNMKEPVLAKMALIGMFFQDAVSRWDEWSLYTASLRVRKSSREPPVPQKSPFSSAGPQGELGTVTLGFSFLIIVFLVGHCLR